MPQAIQEAKGVWYNLKGIAFMAPYAIKANLSDAVYNGDVVQAALSAGHIEDADAVEPASLPVTSAPWKNVVSYGAYGDGSTDDKEAFQAAIDSVEAAGGGTVFLPPGNYVLSDVVNITTTNRGRITIKGSGYATRIIVGSGKNAFHVDGLNTGGEGTYDSTARTTGVHIEGIFFDSVTWATRGAIAISFESVMQSTITNCWFRYLTRGIYTDGTNGGSWAIKVTSCDFDCVTRPIEYYGTHDSIVSNNHIEGISQAATAAGFSEFDDSIVAQGILFDSCTNGLIANNAIESMSDISGTNSGIYIYNHRYDLHLTGNEIDLAIINVVHDNQSFGPRIMAVGNNSPIRITTSGGASAELEVVITAHDGNVEIDGTTGVLTLHINGLNGSFTSTASLTTLNLNISQAEDVTFESGEIATAIIKLADVLDVDFQSGATFSTLLKLKAKHTEEFDVKSAVTDGTINLIGGDGNIIGLDTGVFGNVAIIGCKCSGIKPDNSFTVTDMFVIGCEMEGYIRVTGSSTVTRLVAMGNVIGNSTRLVGTDTGGTISLASIVGNISSSGDALTAENVTKSVVCGNADAKDFQSIAAGTASYSATGYENLISMVTDNAQALTITLPEITLDLLGRPVALIFDTDGGQDVTVNRSGTNTIEENVDSGNTSITLADAGDYIVLQPVTTSFWMVVKNIGCVLA